MASISSQSQWVNSLRPRQNGRHFADDIFKCIFLNENVWIPIKISLKFVPKGPINNIPALVQIMPWRRPGDKTLSETMMVILLTHICVTRPQWVKGYEFKEAPNHNKTKSAELRIRRICCNLSRGVTGYQWAVVFDIWGLIVWKDLIIIPPHNKVVGGYYIGFTP